MPKTMETVVVCESHGIVDQKPLVLAMRESADAALRFDASYIEKVKKGKRAHPLPLLRLFTGVE